MELWKQRIEAGFAALGLWLYRHSLWVVAGVLLVSAGLATQLPRIAIDASTEAYLDESSQARQDYEAFRNQFGRDELIVVAVRPPDVFDPAFLERLGRLHKALEQDVRHVHKVTSLINVRFARGEGDRLIVEDLVDKVPRTPAEIAALRQRVLEHPLYRDLFISRDGHYTALLVETDAYFSGDRWQGDPLAGFDDITLPGEVREPQRRRAISDQQNTHVVEDIQRVLARFATPDVPMYLAGSPVVVDRLKRSMERDMAVFVALSVLVIGALLFLLFRRLSGPLLPLGIVLLSLLATMALTAVLDVPLKLTMTLMPSFLLAVGVGASVHVLAIFYRHYDATGDKPASVAHAMGHAGLPILLTSLTTAAGLGSFVGAQMTPVAELGEFAAIGVLFALVYTVVLLPALLALLPLRRRATAAAEAAAPWWDRLLLAAGDIAARRPRWVLVVALAVIGAAALGLPRLRFNLNDLEWFAPDATVRRDSERIDRALNGTITLDVLVKAHTRGGLQQPEQLRRMDALADAARDYRLPDGRRLVGKTVAVTDLLKEVNQALHENRPAFYALPQRRDLVAQELLLFENSGADDLEDLTDSTYSTGRLTAKVFWTDFSQYVDLVDVLQRKGEALFGNSAQVTVTGLVRLASEAFVAMIHDMVRSYVIAGVVITALMILLLGRLSIGLLSMVPNFAPIVFTLGLMGWLGIALDPLTLLIGSIALGLAVDDTIHFLYHYRRHLEDGASNREAIRNTLATTGRAMLFTTLVLTAGFWIYLFASLHVVIAFGLLTGITLLAALLADIMLAPALLTLLARSAPTAGAGPA